jgi:hypothetical protein
VVGANLVDQRDDPRVVGREDLGRPDALLQFAQ